MVSIIKAGTRKKCTCSDCGCLFSYEEEDVHVANVPFIPLGPNARFENATDAVVRSIECPQCKTIQRLSTAK